MFGTKISCSAPEAPDIQTFFKQMVNSGLNHEMVHISCAPPTYSVHELLTGCPSPISDKWHER